MTTPWLSPQQPAGIEHWDANLIEDWYEAVAQQAYGNSTLGLLGHAMGVLLVAATLWRDAPSMLLLAWAVPVLAQSVFLFQHLKQWPNAVANDTLFHANYTRYTLLSLANGLLWGSVVGLVSFAPSNAMQELILIACVIVTAGQCRRRADDHARAASVFNACAGPFDALFRLPIHHHGSATGRRPACPSRLLRAFRRAGKSHLQQCRCAALC